MGILPRIISLFQKRTTAGVLLFGFWGSIADDVLFVVYGLWLEDSFNVSPVALGLSPIIIGGAEQLGESLTAFFSDRIGEKELLL